MAASPLLLALPLTLLINRGHYFYFKYQLQNRPWRKKPALVDINTWSIRQFR